MTDRTLNLYLRLVGWAAIVGTIIQVFSRSISSHMMMADTGMDAADLFSIAQIFIFGFFITVPLTFALACLCLGAARVMTFKTDTIETVFE